MRRRVPTEQRRRAVSSLWCGSALKESRGLLCARLLLMPLGPKACLLPCMHKGGMPPQVPSDARDASKVEEPVAAAALGSASQGSRHAQTDSEVPELCALIVCCFAIACLPPSALRASAGPHAVGSTGNLPSPTMSSHHHLPLNAFLDTTRDLPLRALELLGRPFPQIVSEHDRTQAQE